MLRLLLSLLFVTSSTIVLAFPPDGVAALSGTTGSLTKRNSPLPARQSKHRRHPIHKKSSAATSRAKRTPIEHVEERGMLDGLPVIGALGGATDSLPTGAAGSPTDALPLPMEKEKRALLSILDVQSLLSTCSTGMSSHQNKLNKAAQRATKYKDSHMNSKFQNSVYQELKAYRGSAAGLPGLAQLDHTLKPLGPDQGLANFDRNNNIEVLIRTLSTGLQDTLESVNLIVFQIPVLGPVLGPIVYDIKCIIDDILNILQVVLDGALNSLSPQLGILSGNYLESTCKMGPSLPCCQ